MNKIVLGTAQFGQNYGVANMAGQPDAEAISNILNFAAENNVKAIDTAIGYGNCEIQLGKSGVGCFDIITKLPEVPKSSGNIYDWIRSQVEGSLTRLEVSQLYGLLVHRPSQLLHSDGYMIYKALDQLKAEGLIRKIGVSIYEPNELSYLFKQWYFDLVQAPFNVLDRRLHSTGWLGYLKSAGVEVHVRSIFLQGLLLMSKSQIPNKFNFWNSLWEEWWHLLNVLKISPLQACLAVPHSYDGINKIVVGIDTLDQFRQIKEALKGVYKVPLPNLSCDDENLINPSKWAKF